MCFKNLIDIYKKNLEVKCKEFGESSYAFNNYSYIAYKYYEFGWNIKKLISLLKENCENKTIQKRLRNSDKLFIDLYYEFNK